MSTICKEEVLAYLQYIVGQLRRQTWLLQRILKNKNAADQVKLNKIFAQVEENKKLLAAAAGKPPAE